MVFGVGENEWVNGSDLFVRPQCLSVHLGVGQWFYCTEMDASRSGYMALMLSIGLRGVGLDTDDTQDNKSKMENALGFYSLTSMLINP